MADHVSPVTTSDVKISELEAADHANATDQLETNQAGTSRRITVAQIRDVVLTGTLESPVFTGNPQTPSPPVGDNDASIPNTAWVQSEIDSAIAGATIDWSQVINEPATFPPSAHGHPWSDLTGVPSSFPPSAHQHPASDITDFSEAVDDRVAGLLVAGTNIALTYSDVTNQLTIGASVPSIPGSLPPSGPAGGDLTGTYPNPTIKPEVLAPYALDTDLANYLLLTGGTLTGPLAINHDNPDPLYDSPHLVLRGILPSFNLMGTALRTDQPNYGGYIQFLDGPDFATATWRGGIGWFSTGTMLASTFDTVAGNYVHWEDGRVVINVGDHSVPNGGLTVTYEGNTTKPAPITGGTITAQQEGVIVKHAGPLPIGDYPGFFIDVGFNGPRAIEMYAWTFAGDGTVTSELDARSYLGAGTDADGIYGFGVFASASRGIPGAPLAVANNDELFYVGAAGWDGASLRGGPYIDWNVLGAVSAGVVPISVDLKMQNGGLPLWKAWEALPDGNTYFGRNRALHIWPNGSVEANDFNALWLNLKGPSCGLSWEETDAPANARIWQMMTMPDGSMQLQICDDAYATQDYFYIGRDATLGANWFVGKGIDIYADAADEPFIGLSCTDAPLDQKFWYMEPLADGSIAMHMANDAFAIQVTTYLRRDGTMLLGASPATGATGLEVATAAWVRAQGYGGGGGGGSPTGTAGGVLSGTYPDPGFASNPVFTGTLQVPEAFLRRASNPTLNWLADSNGTDLKRWESFLYSDGGLYFRVLSDASVALVAIKFGHDGIINATAPAAGANDDTLVTSAWVRSYTTGLGYITSAALAPYLTTATAASTYQPLDPDLTALAGLNATAGLVEQTAAATFTKRLIGVANATDVPTRADADGRYLTPATAASTYAPLASPALTGAPTVGGLAVGYLEVPQNIQNGTPYTCVLADNGKHIYHANAAAASTYNIPANASVAYPIGASLTFVNDSANVVTIAINSDTLVLSPGGTTGSRTLVQYGMATALKVTSTRWFISGTGLT